MESAAGRCQLLLGRGLKGEAADGRGERARGKEEDWRRKWKADKLDSTRKRKKRKEKGG